MLGPVRRYVGLAMLATLSLGLGVFCASACHDDLSRFNTGSGEAYCGSLTAPFTEDGFLVSGVPFGTLAVRLELDTGALGSRPGRLWSNDASSGLCKPSALLEGAQLRAIGAIEHDALSRLSFGEGHVHDFFAWVDTRCQGTLVAVVSLLENGEVELRLLKPMPDGPDDAAPAQRPGFALFRLKKYGDRCGF